MSLMNERCCFQASLPAFKAEQIRRWRLGSDIHVHIFPVGPAQLALLKGDESALRRSAELAKRSGKSGFNSVLERELAHFFLRQILSLYYPVHPTDWEFARNFHGKPYIANRIASSLRFNLSHASGMIAVVVCLRREVGVDLEPKESDIDISDLEIFLLSEEEKRALSDLRGRDRMSAFKKIWALKEAYVKATGQGISDQMPSISFSLDNRRNADLRILRPKEHSDWIVNLNTVYKTFALGIVAQSLKGDVDRLKIEFFPDCAIK